MSLRATLWALYDAPVDEQGPLLVLIALADDAADDGTGAAVGRKTLAKAARCSPRSITRYLAFLEDSGVITPGDQRAVAHIRGDRRPTVYDLAIGARRVANLSTREEPRVDETVSSREAQRVDNDETTGGQRVDTVVLERRTVPRSPLPEELASAAVGRGATGEQASEPEPEPDPEPTPISPTVSDTQGDPDPDLAAISDLRDALAAAGLGVTRWDRLTPAETAQVAGLIARHGTGPLVASAVHAARQHGGTPPGHARAWLPAWSDLRAPAHRPAQAAGSGGLQAVAAAQAGARPPSPELLRELRAAARPSQAAS